MKLADKIFIGSIVFLIVVTFIFASDLVYEWIPVERRPEDSQKFAAMFMAFAASATLFRALLTLFSILKL